MESRDTLACFTMPLMLLGLSSTFASLELVLAYIVGDALKLRGQGHK
jgi:hypothetical protein